MIGNNLVRAAGFSKWGILCRKAEFSLISNVRLTKANLKKKMAKKKTQKKPQKTSRLKEKSKGILIFIIGTLFGLFVVQWFVGLLPGPNAELIVNGFTSNTSTTKSCIYYQISLNNDGPIEYIYAKIQLPNKITNHSIGIPVEAELPNSNRTRLNIFACGKDEKGECVIKPPAEINLGSVQAYSAGNMITIQASKLPQKTTIMGMVATNEKISSINPKPKLFTEGEYEYMKFGQTVRKPLKAFYGGKKELK